LLLLGSASPYAAELAARRFSPLGTVAVFLLAITAAFQFRVLIGGLPGLIGTGYGLTALSKAALFAMLLGLASVNRFHLTPLLATPASKIAKRRLAISIATETGVGLVVVLAAGLLTSLPQAMHMQPIWPLHGG
jgi:putative copper export protein